LDLAENIIEAKPIAGSNATNAAKTAAFPSGFAALAMIVVVLFRRIHPRLQRL
jgi:hypothetical protein